MELHIINMIYVALPIRKQTEKLTFFAKTTSAKLYIYIGVGSRDLFIDEAHIPGIFSLHAAYSALRHFFLDPDFTHYIPKQFSSACVFIVQLVKLIIQIVILPPI